MSSVRALGLVFSLVAAIAFVGVLSGCEADPVDTVSTDFGNAVATSSVDPGGDLESWLTSPDGDRLLGELSFVALDGRAEAMVEDQQVSFSGVLVLPQQPHAEVNLMLYSLWDIEVSAPDVTMCFANQLVTCCRDGSWHCQAK